MKNLFGAIVVLLASAAHAGKLLHFQNGDIDPQTVISQSAITFNNIAEDFVVQFHQSVTESDKADLRAQGISIFRYVPEDALIVRATAYQLSALQQNGRIDAFIPFKGRIKLSMI